MVKGSFRLISLVHGEQSPKVREGELQIEELCREESHWGLSHSYSEEKVSKNFPWVAKYQRA